jgi:hypothetical protein
VNALDSMVESRILAMDANGLVSEQVVDLLFKCRIIDPNTNTKDEI